MKKLFLIFFVLVSSIGFCVGTTVDDRTGQNIVGLSKVGIGTSTPAVGFVNTGFSQLGELGPKLKCAYIASDTSSSVGGASAHPHGISPASKIVGVSVQVLHDANSWVYPSYTAGANAYYFEFVVDATNITVYLGASASSITNKPWTALIWYIE